MKEINIFTLGCSKNTVDSENLAGHFSQQGYKVVFDKEAPSDIVIINTCGFIGDAKEESIDAIVGFAELRKKGSVKMLIVCGCLIERYKEEMSQEVPEVDYYFGVHQWEEIVKLITSEQIDDFRTKRQQSTPRHYAYLKIAEGCSRACSYCAIPMIRGNHRSRSIEEIVAEAKELVQNGVKELLVISQDVTYYGKDLYGKKMLPDLLERLATETTAEWIRIHYTYPTAITDEMIKVIKKYPQICNYIDIPLQHVDTDILKSMNRGVTETETINLIEKLKKEIPEVALRTTLIVGYPGETEDRYQKLKTFVERMRFDRLGVFAFSPEEGTEACNLKEQIDERIAQYRIDELMSIQEKISLEKNTEKIGKKYRVLIDRKQDDYWVGRTEYDSPEVDNEVLIKTPKKLKIGEFYKVEIIGANEFDLEGKVEV